MRTDSSNPERVSHYGGILDTRRPLFSIVVPYYDRLPYLERILWALVDQDIEHEQFEIVIACLEYSAALLKVLDALPATLHVRCIMVREPWKVARARNLAIHQAEAEVLVLLDSDMLLPKSFLRHLRDDHDLIHEDCVLIGQMLNYSAYTDVPVEALRDYEYYRDTYLARNCRDGLGVDARWVRDRRILWSLCWTALMVIPSRLVQKHSLYFDESFVGWGAEDLEWGYRVQQTGVQIHFADDLWGVHLPHKRCVAQNCAEQERNYDHFLRKWPCFEVEIVTRFGDAFANQHFDELCSAWAAVRGGGEAVNVVEFSVGAARQLALGAISDSSGKLINCRELSSISQARITAQVPLLGFRLPYADRSVERSYLLPSLHNAPANLQTLIVSETQRISSSTIRL